MFRKGELHCRLKPRFDISQVRKLRRGRRSILRISARGGTPQRGLAQDPNSLQQRTFALIEQALVKKCICKAENEVDAACTKFRARKARGDKSLCGPVSPPS